MFDIFGIFTVAYFSLLAGLHGDDLCHIAKNQFVRFCPVSHVICQIGLRR